MYYLVQISFIGTILERFSQFNLKMSAIVDIFYWAALPFAATTTTTTIRNLPTALK